MVYDTDLVLFTSLCCPRDAGFRLWEKGNYRGTINTTGNEENPELVVSNVYKRTSVPGGPSFGSMGLPVQCSAMDGE